MKLLDNAQKFNNIIMQLLPFIVVAFFIVLGFILFKKHNGNSNGKLGQLKKGNKEKSKGIIFGKSASKFIYSPCACEGHVSVLGGSGLGKTSALLIPTLRSWNGTSFTIDISGDICSNVQMPNKIIYEPADVDTTPYNAFGAIDDMDDDDDKNEALEMMAFLLMPDKANASDASEFFTREGRKILTAALIAFYDEGMDFIEICECIVTNGYIPLFTLIEQTGNDVAINYISSFEGASQQNTAGCKQSCDTALKLFATNAKVKRTIRRPIKDEDCFTPKEIETHNVFVIVPDNKLTLYSPLLHLITAQTLAFFSDRPLNSKTMILLSLDEFASLGKMEIIEALRKFRKRKVRIIVLTQGMPDIDLIYGKNERNAMMNNFRFKVILGIEDTDTQDYFAKLIGHKIVKKVSVSSGIHGRSSTTSEAREFAIQPDDLAKLNNDLVLIYPDGYMKLKKNFYFKQK